MTSSSEAGGSGGRSSPRVTAQSGQRQTLGKYEIRKKIGSGGMGTVFLAVDADLKRTVALKVLSKEKSQNPTLVKRFKAEAQAAAQLRHENLVTVYEAGDVDGYPYIALEYVDGRDLHHYVSRRGPLTVRRSVEVIMQIARALEHAHEHNVVHRDIKPSNMLITRDGTVKLTDFGLARVIDEELETGITRAGTTVGTVDYMSPEQARSSKAADIRSDIYSLGCAWYHMLTGKPPFAEGSVTTKLNAHAISPLPDPRLVNAAVPEGVVAVMHRMMAKAPQDRYQTPAELLADLQSRHLVRETVSNDILAALADADDGEDGDADSPLNSTQVVLDEELAGPAAATAPSSSGDERIVRARRPSRAPADEGSGGQAARPRRAAPREEPAAPTDDEPMVRARRPKSAPAVEQPAPRAPRPVGTPVVAEVEEGPLAPVPRRTRTAAKEDQPAPRKAKRARRPRAQAAAAPLHDNPDGKPVTLPEEKRGVNLESLRYLLVAAIVVGILGLLYWASQQFSGTLDVALPGGPMPVAPGHQGVPTAPTTATAGHEAPQSAQARSADGRPTVELRQSSNAIDVSDAVDQGEIAVGRPLEREHMLSWVAELASPPPRDQPQTVTVGGPDGVADLASALEKVSATGGTVQLAGNGPFELPPTRLDGEKPITMAAVPGNAPVVVLAPEGAASDAALVRIAGGTLLARGIHFVVLAHRLPREAEASLFDLSSGDLTLQGCSLTLIGRPAARVAAVRLSPDSLDAGSARRLLLDRTLARGQNLTALRIDTTAAECVASNCLFVTGEAPLVSVTGQETPAAGDDERSEGRIVQIFSCTGHAGNAAFEFSSGSRPTDPPATRIVTMNSVVSTSPQNDGAALLALHNWPLVDPNDRGASRARNLQWQTDTCLFAGWETLLKAEGPTEESVTEAEAWKAFWGQPAGEVRAQSAGWPSRPVEDHAAVTPRQFDPATLDGGLKTLEGKLVGIDPADVPSPPRGLLDRIVAQTERPDPASLPFGRDAPAQTVQVDLSKEELGRVIGGRDWPTGTRFVVSGSGTQRCTPIQITGKSFRIEFVPSGSAPLVMEPRGAGPQQPWIDVAGGTLELVGGRFRIPSSRGDTPRSFLRVTDGSFALADCHVLGPMVETTGHPSLIHWAQTARPDAEPQRHAALIRDCFLADSQPVLQADLRGQALVAQNSVLAGTGDLLVLHVAASDGPASAIDLRNCTLSSGAAFFDVRGTAGGAAATGPPLRLFVEQTVFAPPLDSGGQKPPQPVLLRDRSDLSGAGQIEWWGSSNGYTPDLAAFVQRSADGPPPTGQDFEADWVGMWGGAHEVRPLTGRDGVRLQKAYPHRAKIGPADFALWEHAKARQWGDGGQPIGAAVQTLTVPEPQPEPEPKKPAQPARPTRPGSPF